MTALRVNKTKVTSETSFIVNRLALGGKNESKYHESTHFGGSRIQASFQTILVSAIFANSYYL